MLRNMTSIYITQDNKMLMLYRVGSRVVQSSWCGIGGHFEKDELNDPKACVLRELLEETGITEQDIENVELKYIILRQREKETRQIYYFFARLCNPEIKIDECPEGTLEWVEIDKVLEKDMPFTAKECLKHYLSIGKDIDISYAGVATEGGVNFIELKDF